MNWGTKIILGMIAFMLFIVGMVVYMFKINDDDALVEKDYYEKGINYDQEYDAQKNTLDDNLVPKIEITNTQIIIQLKEAADHYKIKLLRPSAAKEDINQEGSPIGDHHMILIDRTKMSKGLWMLSLEWKSNGKPYLYKKDITL